MKKIFTLFAASILFVSAFAQNRALDFDGVDDYVRIPESSSLPTTAITVEMWFNPVAVSYSNCLFSKSYFTVYCGFGGIPAWEAGSILSFDLYTTDGGNRLSYSLPTSLVGTWHHVAITYNGSEKRFYLDGALVAGPQALTGTIFTEPGSPFLIGDLATFTNSYKGVIDEFRIWNVARTATEIAANRMMEIAPNTAGLVAYYKFNQGTANGNNAGINSLIDAAPVPHNGEVWNFALNGSTSNWVGGYPSLVVLPVRFSSFAASKVAGGINLDWKTSVQKDVVSFDVERSGDAQNFSKIGSVTARQNGGNDQSYQYTDRLPLNGNNYYRLKTIENSGNINYTKALLVKTSALTSLSVYPNPSTDVLILQTVQKGKFTVRIQDEKQRVVKMFELTSNGSLLVTPINISGFPTGVYLLRAGDDVIKFIKQ